MWTRSKSAGGGQQGSEPAEGEPAQSAQLRFVCFVRTPDNKNIAVEADPSSTVGAVVEQALWRSSCSRLRVEQVYVQAAGHHLELQATLEQAGVGAMSTLRVTPNPAAIRCQPLIRDIALKFQALEGVSEDISFLKSQALCAELRMAVAPLHITAPCLPKVSELVSSGLLQALRELYLHPRVPVVTKVCALDGLQYCADGLQIQHVQALKERPCLLEPACLCFDLLLKMLVPMVMESRRGFKGSEWAASTIMMLAGNLDVAKALPGLGAQGQGAEGEAARERLLGCLASHASSLLGCAASTFTAAFAGKWCKPLCLAIVCSVLSAACKHCSTGLLQQDRLQWERVCGAAEGLFSLISALHEGSDALLGPTIHRGQAWEAKRRELFLPVSQHLRHQCGRLTTDMDLFLAAVPLPPDGAYDAEHLGGMQQVLLDAAPWLDTLLALRITAWMAIWPYTSNGEPHPTMVVVAKDMLETHTHAAMQACQQVSPELVVQSRTAFSSFLDHLPAHVRLTHLREHAAEQSVPGMDEEEDEDEPTTIYVSREEVLETSYAELLPMRPWQLTRELLVCFTGEPGYGAGVTREWLGMLLSQLLSPALGLFTRCGGNAKAIFPSATASVQPQHLQYLRVAGRAMGLALLHGVPLRCHLAAAFHSGLGRHPCDDMEQLQEVDPQMWRSLQAVLVAEDASSLGLTFTLPCDHLGQSVDVPLAEDPSKPVTNANRLHYVQSAAKHLLRTRVQAEVAAVRQGLVDVLKMCPTQLFSCQALNSLIEGAPGSLSTQQWRQHTRCSGWDGWRGPVQQDGMEVDGAAAAGAAEPEVLRWFWLLVGEMREEQRSAMLHFWTSLTCLPEGGFGALPQQLRIVRADPASQPLPVARTCFYELLLPAYADILSLAGALKEAIAHAEGFGMA